MSSSIIAVVLAAGKGTRMKSAVAKVLHPVFFRPMIHHVLDTVIHAGIEKCAVIIGHQREAVEEALASYRVDTVLQKEQLGTGHAVLCAQESCAGQDAVLILCGDTPLVRPETLQEMIKLHQRENATLTLMTTLVESPFGYGRILRDTKGHITGIVEQKDASESQRQIQEINAGIYLVKHSFLFEALSQVGTNNAQGEVYLTDIVALAKNSGLPVQGFVHPDPIDVLGVNSRVELAQAQQTLQQRRTLELMIAGVTLESPETILVSADCILGQDCQLEPNVRLSAGTTLGSGCLVGTGAVLKNCQLGDRVRIGAHAVLIGCTLEADSEVAPLTYQNHA
ncbi:bifunctional N-acetylglucosamine-1-phosphate uridyltransferase/glucosamine-1-phosphate acetyltransferase [Desulfobulbus rhabdoformis]|uniref:bifunctional UDP-N-acetylglucosamine diphosphorylase/glucosamine-1-phosphate N-acetyltransferase GlmU n=1 Tax=Desulfobulbus rhabdoformis TaxID=34032 RepID=UPI001962B69D|nr:NTP transferase domain-containing protein [Desulfobulbus rhabdoformis]MBM9613365.1 bifunctional N-acetylglucosamine-1-phosphate uridyltransferase/glucosamine-1-phosphate acetyltransferase [Desulfobulbus rhabdoformis]